MNILAIGAHFDDIELGCGGSIAKHVAQGDSVYVYVATDSGFINHANQIIRSSEVAKSEAEAAMRVLGVKELICGSFKTLDLEFIDGLNVEILRIVEKKRSNVSLPIGLGTFIMIIRPWLGHHYMAVDTFPGC